MKRKERLTTGIPLFARIKEEDYIWCKHQAKPYHQTRERVGRRMVLKRAMYSVSAIIRSAKLD